MSVTIHTGDWVECMRALPDASVQMVGPSSPPYLGLRSYLPAGHPAKAQEIGSEPTPDEFIAALVAGFREARRILRPDGILVLNLGDSYAGSGKGPTGHNGIGDQEGRQGFTGRNAGFNERWGNSPGQRKQETSSMQRQSDIRSGLPPKNLLMIPFRVALALQGFSVIPGAALMQMADGLRDARLANDWTAVEIIEGALRRWAAASAMFDGWILRSVIPWVKRSCMPESVQDRPASAIEYLFLFSKSARYYWDAEAIKKPLLQPDVTVAAGFGGHKRNGGTTYSGNAYDASTLTGRNYRNSDAFFATWQGLMLDEGGDPLALIVNPKPNPLPHFASFPDTLVQPFIRAGTSQRGQCPACGAPWVRVTERIKHGEREKNHRMLAPLTGTGNHGTMGVDGNGMRYDVDYRLEVKTTGWQPSCRCDAGPPVPQTILDPFAGTGTTLLVADRLGRSAIGVELNPEYAEMARNRIATDAGFLDETTVVPPPPLDRQPDIFEVAG
jgi:hypothetical protein